MILFPFPNMTQGQFLGAYVLFPFDTSQDVTVPVEVNTSVTDVDFNAFERVYVNYIYKGTATISWQLAREFSDPGPYTFQLQASQGGTPTADDWFNVGPTTSNFFATDDGGTYHQRMFGKTPTLVYRVILTTPLATYVSPIANVLGLLNKHDWLIVREILRKEQLSHSIFSSVRGYLLKARRYGPECPECRDSSVPFITLSGATKTLTDEIINTNCGTCYGTGFVNGYYPIVEYFSLLQNENSREYRGPQGTMKPLVIQGRFLATLPLIQGDVWVNIGSDERYYIHTIIESAGWKSVPIVYSAELRLAPFTDAVYNIPLL